MAVFGEMIRRMHAHAAPLANVNLEYLAEQLFNGRTNIPHFEFLEESDSEGKLTHAKGFEIYFDPKFDESLKKLIEVRADTLRHPLRPRDRVPFEKAFAEELTGVFQGTIRGDTKERALTTLVGPAVAQKAGEVMTSLKLNPAERLKVFETLAQSSNSVVKGAARALKLRLEGYNTALLANSFRNPFLYTHWEDALLAGIAGITKQEKGNIDSLIMEFFKDRRNQSSLYHHEELMEHLDSLILMKQGEDVDVYFGRISTPPHQGILAPVVSPTVAQILFNTRDFPRFTEGFSQKLGLTNGKVESMKRQYEDFLKSVYRASLVHLIRKRIRFSDKPGQINLGRYLVSPLNIVSPLTGFDVARSTPVVEALKDNAPDFLSALKTYIGDIIESHQYDGEYLNDMGDGQFYCMPSVKQSVLAAYELLQRLKSPETKKRIIDDVFETELSMLNIGLEQERGKHKELSDAADSMKTDSERISRMFKETEAAEAGKRAVMFSEMQKPLEEARQKIYDLFPGVRLTIVYDRYKMPKVRRSTATGRAAYRVNRALGSEGHPGEGHPLVEIRQKAQGSSCVYHEGILLLKEPVETLKRELGPGNFTSEDETAKSLTQSYRRITGNNNAVVYAAKGLAYQKNQIYLAYLGKADIKSYPNEDMWSVLTEDDMNNLADKTPTTPSIPVPTLTLPPIEPAFKITRDPFAGTFKID